MAGVAGCVALDLVAVLLERVDELCDLAGQLEKLFVAAELLVLGGELGMELDPRHRLSMASDQYCCNAILWAAGTRASPATDRGNLVAGHRLCSVGG